MQTSNYLIKPVGSVISEIEEVSLVFRDRKLERRDMPDRPQRREVISELVFDESYEDCLDGIEDFSHVIVLYWANRIPEEGRDVRKVHPAGKKDNPLVGVFATRSPARPNPVCVTTVRLLQRQGNFLRVKGLEAVDGSPIIDVKPHIPFADAPSDVKLSDWMQALIDDLSNDREKQDLSGLHEG